MPIIVCVKTTSELSGPVISNHDEINFSPLKRHRIREPGSDGNLNVMFVKKIQIICLMTHLTKGEEGQTLKITIWDLVLKIHFLLIVSKADYLVK